MQLSGLGEIKLVGLGGRGRDKVSQLLGESEGTCRVVQELGGAVEVRQLESLGFDGFERVGELGSNAAEGGLEGGDGGSDGGEGVVGVLEGRELRQEVGVAGEDLGAELGLELANRVVELLGGGGWGAGGERGGGEGGGREAWGEEGGEDWVGGEGI